LALAVTLRYEVALYLVIWCSAWRFYRWLVVPASPMKPVAAWVLAAAGCLVLCGAGWRRWNARAAAVRLAGG
jgi:hypothetical protein